MDVTNRPEHDPEKLKAELVQLKIETRNLIRNYPLNEAFDMQSGMPRVGAAANERMAREKFARIEEIELVLNTMKWFGAK